MVSAPQDATGTRVARASTTVLMIATVALLLAVAGAAIAAWVITRQPAEQPLDRPRSHRPSLVCPEPTRRSSASRQPPASRS